jgi:hypothetical protein
MESIMIMMSRIEAEMRIRQQQLIEEMEREQQAEHARQGTMLVSGTPRVQSQFFTGRFGAIMTRLKIQPA